MSEVVEISFLLTEEAIEDIIWRCKCKCGKEGDVVATLLITMNTTSYSI